MRHNKAFIRAVICCAIQTHLSPEGQVCTGGTHIHMMVTDALLQTELSVLCAGLAPIKHRNLHYLGQLCALSASHKAFMYMAACPPWTNGQT